MGRKRKSNASRPSHMHQDIHTGDIYTNTDNPRSPFPHQSARPRTSTRANLMNNAAAVLLALISIFSEGGKGTRIPIVLGILFILFALYVFSIYVIIPFFSLLMYPLFPVKWGFLKVYGVVWWSVSWIVYLFKGTAWFGFYIYFFLEFCRYAGGAIEYVLSGLEEGKAAYDREKNEDMNGHQPPATGHHRPAEEDDDDDMFADMPPLEQPPSPVDAAKGDKQKRKKSHSSSSWNLGEVD